jgi:hypothetical protein
MISHQLSCWWCIAVARNDSYCRTRPPSFTPPLRTNIPRARRDCVVTASSRDGPIHHGRPNLDVPNPDTPRASPIPDTGRSRGSRTQDNRHTPSEGNNRRRVVEGQTGQHSAVGLHTGAARPGQPQPRERRPTESPSAARLMTSRRSLRAWNRLRSGLDSQT